jgi:2-oxoglutarate ferredoxin oxidoreductase subunit delta
VDPLISEATTVEPEHVELESDTKKKQDKRKRKLPRGRVTIFPNWCKGCDLCVIFCPAGVLGEGPDDRVVVAHPEKCTACRWCELHCPDFAIFVTDIEPDSEEDTE